MYINCIFLTFRWHEIGVYDLPAIIDHVLNMTSTDKVHYVGHSQGTTSFFVMCSERPDYNKRIKVMVALAPAVFYRYFKHPIFKLIAPFYRLLGVIYLIFQSYRPQKKKLEKNCHKKIFSTTVNFYIFVIVLLFEQNCITPNNFNKFQKLLDEFNVYELPIFLSNKNLQIITKALCGKNHLLPYDVCHAILSLLLDDTEMDKVNIILQILSRCIYFFFLFFCFKNQIGSNN